MNEKLYLITLTHSNLVANSKTMLTNLGEMAGQNTVDYRWYL
jgi:hypothetical protein